jgi:hypothetical protein
LVGVNLDVKRRNRKRQRENGQPGGAGHRLRRRRGSAINRSLCSIIKGALSIEGFHRHLPRIALPLQLTVQHPCRSFHGVTTR